MIQLRQIRINRAGKEIEGPLPNDTLVFNLKDLFSQIDTVISKIDVDERYNLFYTRGHTVGGFSRAWHEQEVIPFDIDDLRVVDGKLDPSFEPDIPKLLEVIFSVLKVDINKCVVVSSGNGLQILVQAERMIKDAKFFIDYAGAYASLCSQINEALFNAKLPGKTDSAVFSINGVLRLPMTKNRKAGKPERDVTLLYSNLEPQPFVITPPAPGVSALEPWQAEKGDALPEKTTRYSKIDEPAVEKGCEFLKSAKEHPEDLNESQWYALLSIVGRFGDTEKIHEYSKGHPGYSRKNTEAKAKQATDAAGPRTCKGVDKVWGQCSTCVWNTKIASPVLIKEKTFIATEKAGFHSVSKSGSLTPVPADMQMYFSREQPYVVSKESGAVFVFDGKKYIRWSDTELRAFAEANFDPKVQERAIQEFVKSVTRNNLFKENFFQDTTRGRVNFQNGVYSIEDKELYPHSPEYGFLYVLPFEYQPKEECPNFDKFIDGFTSGDKEQAEVLKEFIGYAICDEAYDFQKCLVILGSGSNGKSTLFKIIDMLIGESNISNLSLDDLTSVTARSGLEGKLLNLCDELPTEHFADTSSFKNLFGGKTQARRLFKDAQTLRNRAKFIFLGNEMPVSKDTTEGFLRRLIFIMARATFKDGENADPRIADKIRSELPGVFNVVMHAYERARTRGALADSAAGRAKHQSYRNSIDQVRSWFEDHVVVSPDLDSGFTSINELFLAYQNFCEMSNERKPTKENFSKKLQHRIKDWDKRHVRKRIGKDRVYVLHGVKITDDKEVSSEF